MPTLIKGSQIVADAWRLVEERDRAIDDLPCGDIIVPMALWKAEREALRGRCGKVGLWIDADEEAEEIAGDVASLPLIAVNFPSFVDGRGLSTAVLLRTRLGFRGELRAIGDVRRDWLSYMRRCGFDSYQLASKEDPEQALQSLTVMSDYYQGSVVEPVPLFRRKQRS